jgi:hypothetical protein
LQTDDLPFQTATAFVYREGAVTARKGAVAMDLHLGVNLQGNVVFDDVRVLDENLLRNAGFETREPTGQDDSAPGWRFERGGRVIAEPANARSGVRAVALEGTSEYRQITQRIDKLTGASSYRVSAWVKTEGLDAAPTIRVCFDNGGERTVSQILSEGAYRYVSAVVPAPAGAKQLTLRLRLEANLAGTAYFDDLLIEPLE